MISRLAAISLVAILVTATGCVRVSGQSDEDRFPEFTNYVVDAADVVPDDAEAEANQELKAYQDETGVQIAVATVDTTGDQSLEDYSIDLAKHWGLGEAEEDNGVLLLIVVEDRRLRIEVGEGIEGEMTDLESGRITDNDLPPLLREGEYGEAILLGTRQIRRAISGDIDLPGAAPPEETDGGGRRIPGGGLWGIAPLFFLPFLLGARRRRRAPVFWGGGTVQSRRDRSGRRRLRDDEDDDHDRHDNWLAAALLGGLLLGGGRRGGWGGGDFGGGGDIGGGFGGGGGGDFGGGGASGDW